MATRKQVLACRRNGRLGGPRTAAGKAVARLNARKHGIFASALTAEDAEELGGLHTELAAWLGPVGPVEAMLVDKLAHTYLRMQRCARAEAECHVKVWEAKGDPGSVRLYETACREGRHASWFDVGRFEDAVRLFGRYDQTLTNQFIKLLHEIERIQRLRDGEDVAPPLAADVNVCVEGDADAAGGCVVPAGRSTGEGTTAEGLPAGAGGCVVPAGRSTGEGTTAEGGCATPAGSGQGGPTASRETNQIGQKPLADKRIQRAPGTPPRPPRRVNPGGQASMQPTGEGTTAGGGCATPAGSGQGGPTASRETNQIDQKPLLDKEMQSGREPPYGGHVPATGGQASTGPAKQRHSFTRPRAPGGRGQAFFQKKGTARPGG